ncbi:Flp family type IVb pilin [Marinobacter arenosus]|uniref:Flp family type IVb pilin n=1 Tax=Marinobacter arenosus TaxID=2856822 RepID=UPI001C4CB1EF|nr:Flp family type IVb pilin [Marinobacter arenosus]MBW0146111.1 Flp family type IVb pilin [Marinobacter arenosus]
MKNLKSKIAQFLRDEEGLELSEYAVAGSLIVIGTVAAFAALSTEIGLAIDEITGVIRDGAPAAP